MKLKHTKEVKILVDSDDLDVFIQRAYDQSYEFIADIEANNNSSYKYNVKKEKLDDYEQEVINNFIEEGNFSNFTRLLLIDLCNKDIIEEGNYLINVNW